MGNSSTYHEYRGEKDPLKMLEVMYVGIDTDVPYKEHDILGPRVESPGRGRDDSPAPKGQGPMLDPHLHPIWNRKKKPLKNKIQTIFLILKHYKKNLTPLKL